MLEALLSNGARTIIVETLDRFARDLVQLAGRDMLKAKGVTLVAASAPCTSSRARRPAYWCAGCWALSPSSRRRRSSPSSRRRGGASARLSDRHKSSWLERGSTIGGG
jgi:hypothetical protein